MFANNCIFMSLDDFRVLPAQLCNKVIYVWNFESHIQFARRCGPSKVTNGAENFVLQALRY